jgi:hypothetical protein
VGKHLLKKDGTMQRRDLGPSVRCNITIPEIVLEHLDKKASAAGMTRSGLLVLAYLERLTPKETRRFGGITRAKALARRRVNRARIGTKASGVSNPNTL